MSSPPTTPKRKSTVDSGTALLSSPAASEHSTATSKSHPAASESSPVASQASESATLNVYNEQVFKAVVRLTADRITEINSGADFIRERGLMMSAPRTLALAESGESEKLRKAREEVGRLQKKLDEAKAKVDKLTQASQDELDELDEGQKKCLTKAEIDTRFKTDLQSAVVSRYLLKMASNNLLQNATAKDADIRHSKARQCLYARIEGFDKLANTVWQGKDGEYKIHKATLAKVLDAMAEMDEFSSLLAASQATYRSIGQ